MDVSVAFLKGYTFKKLEEKGMTRRPVGVVPCEGVMQLLAEIDPAVYGKLPPHSKEYILRLLKGAYGLRDAPLLWHLKAVEVLLSLQYRQMRHDTCVFLLWKDGALVCIATLHVDDLLATGPDCHMLALHKSLSENFSGLSIDWDNFKHFGVDVATSAIKDADRKITASQEKYISDLNPIELPPKYAKSGKVPPETVTQYRSLVSGMAWTGVTAPQSVASASLLQGCLPEPTWFDVERVNNNLAQLKSEYVPLMYQKIPEPWRFVNVGDSSFANSDKYSQGGSFCLIAHDGDESLCDKFLSLIHI